MKILAIEDDNICVINSFKGNWPFPWGIAFIINDAKKLNAEISRYKDIPVVSNVTQQQVMDNYYQVKMEVKRLILEEVDRLKKSPRELKPRWKRNISATHLELIF